MAKVISWQVNSLHTVKSYKNTSVGVDLSFYAKKKMIQEKKLNIWKNK